MRFIAYWFLLSLINAQNRYGIYSPYISRFHGIISLFWQDISIRCEIWVLRYRLRFTDIIIIALYDDCIEE